MTSTNALDPHEKKGRRLMRLWQRRTVQLTAVVAVALAATAAIVSPWRTGEEQPDPATALVQQTERLALAAARSAGKPAEVLALRQESREVYANPDGTFTEDIHEEPVRAIRNGQWVPIDRTLVRTGDGAVVPRATVADLRFSGGGSEPLATIGRAGRSYGLVWPESLPEPRLNGDTATYPEVRPGVDLMLRAATNGFAHLLVVKTPQAAASLGKIDFSLKLTLLKASVVGNGGLLLTDKGTGGAVFDTPTPRMWDADRSHTASMGLTVSGDHLSLSPDRTMLADPTLHYPLYLDPFTSGTTNESWAMVDSGYPSEEYWKFDGEAEERAGYCPVGVPGEYCDSSRIKRLFYVLPTNFSGKTILNAKFRVTLQHVWNSTPRNVSLYRAGSNGALITSATNWGNMPGGSGMSGFVKQDTIAPTGTTSCQSGSARNTEFDAEEALKNAVSRGWSKTTFLLRSDNESNYEHGKRFCHNAVLSVTYNRAPNAPPQSALTSDPGGVCTSGTNRPYVSSLPKLKATLTDPDTADGEPLTAEFKVTWTPAGGTAQSKGWTSSQLANKSTFTYNLADNKTGVPALPENIVVKWQVRAHDGTSPGGWNATPCEFILDKTSPAGPDIDSPEYLPLDAADKTPDCLESAEELPGVGRYGTFTFDSSATDVVSYQYGINTNPLPVNVLTPATAGGPVTLRWLPETAGTHNLNVVAVDRAGKQSSKASCMIRIAEGSQPVAEWRLDDPDGSAKAGDSGEAGHLATAGPGAAFGAEGPGGAADRAVHLSGGQDGWLASDEPALVDTAREVTVSVWARLTDATRHQTVLSIDGSGESALRLGYSPDSGKWTVVTPITDVRTLGTWSLNGPVATVGKWTHLSVVLDPTNQRMSLTVDGGTSITAARRFSWSARGQIQVGRRFIRTGLYGDSFAGDIADVRAYDRLLTARELVAQPKLLTTRLAYWDLDGLTPVDGQAPLVGRSSGYGNTAELEPAMELGVYGGARHYRRLQPDEPDFDPFARAPLVGDGHLVLDGATGYAATTGPVAATTGSFSVAARVQLATDCTAGPMTLLSQPGTTASGFSLRCVPDGSGDARWEAIVPGTDADDPATVVVTGTTLRPDPTADGGQFIVLTYDAAYQTLRLYVNGQLIGSTDEVPKTWASTAGGLQIGRGRVDAAWTGHFAGVVDEVRVYTGVLDETTVQQLNSLTAVPDL